MIEENSGPAKSVPLSEVSHLVSVPLSEVLLYTHIYSIIYTLIIYTQLVINK